MSPTQVVLDPEQPRFLQAADSFDYGSVVISRALAEAYHDIAKREGLVFFDAAPVAHAGSDGVHLTLASHAALARAVAGLITR